ncbi:MAG: ABC transporter permease subunit [Pirellulales bacterium]
MIRRPISRRLAIILAVISLVVLGSFYELLSLRQTRINEKQMVVPSYTALAKGVVRITAAQGTEEKPKPSWLWEDFRATYWRLLLGITVGVVCSIVLGIAIGCYTFIDAALSPMITFMAKIPPTAMLGVYMILFGTHLSAYIALVSLGIIFSMVLSISRAVQTDVTPDQIDKAYTLGASEFEVIIEVVWRQILPRVIDAVRAQIGPAMIYLIAAEAMFGSEGFGYRIRLQSRLSNMDVVYPYLLILGGSGLFFDWGLDQLRRRLCPWFGEQS